MNSPVQTELSSPSRGVPRSARYRAATSPALRIEIACPTGRVGHRPEAALFSARRRRSGAGIALLAVAWCLLWAFFVIGIAAPAARLEADAPPAPGVASRGANP